MFVIHSKYASVYLFLSSSLNIPLFHPSQLAMISWFSKSVSLLEPDFLEQFFKKEDKIKMRRSAFPSFSLVMLQLPSIYKASPMARSPVLRVRG